jgi:flagellar basal-body rod protein FlgC
MSHFSDSLSLSASGLKAQSQRLQHVSENIANADTPGYRRKTVSFRSEAEGLGTDALRHVTTGPVGLDRSALPKIHDPGHPLADDTGHYEGSNVSLVIEMADAREAQRSYEANLKMFEQARQMSSRLLELLRR